MVMRLSLTLGSYACPEAVGQNEGTKKLLGNRMFTFKGRNGVGLHSKAELGHSLVLGNRVFWLVELSE